MPDFEILTPGEFVRRVGDAVSSKHRRSTYSSVQFAPTPVVPAPYALIVGAGFSAGVVPLVKELMYETIGDYLFFDQDQSSMQRASRELRKHSATVWSEINAAARRRGASGVALDGNGLPYDAGEAYRALFEIDDARVVFARIPRPRSRSGLLERMTRARRAARGENPPIEETPPVDGVEFVRGFLQYVVNPGSEHGHGSTGRTDLNDAHVFLASILEAQQTGAIGPFCRTILTTNFDTLLQNALQMVNLLYRVTDRPETGFDAADLLAEEAAIHLVYVHGSILRHNPASSVGELSALSHRNADAFHKYLTSRDVIAIGYGGWEDGLMTALKSCENSNRLLYWCDIPPAPSDTLAGLLQSWGKNANYVSLGAGGADGLMELLYRELVPATSATRDPRDREKAWRTLNRPIG